MLMGCIGWTFDDAVVSIVVLVPSKKVVSRDRIVIFYTKKAITLRHVYRSNEI